MQTNIRDHGASTDASAINSAAIQRAIDACHEAGGGTVHCPPGVWRTGSIWLKSRTTLDLAAGCTLLASDRREDYNPEPAMPESTAFGAENVTDHHLVLAYDAEHIAITGRGTIDGNSRAFINLGNRPNKWTRDFDWRPGQMIQLVRCRHVLVEGVSLLNAPYWTLFPHACEDVVCRGLTIVNPDDTPNGDGIDIDCCRHVRIEGCHISSGDDCITLRGYVEPLKEAMPCEDVTVSNCVLHSPCQGIRIGVGSGLIQRCVFENIVIRQSLCGISIVSHYSERQSGPGTTMRDIRFANMIIEADQPLHVSTGVAGTAAMQDIHFSGIDIIGGPSFVGGSEANPMRRVVLHDVNVRLTRPGMPDAQVFADDFAVYPPWTFHRAAAGAGLCVSDIEDASIEHLRLHWAEAGGVRQYGVVARRVKRLSMVNVSGSTPPAEADVDQAVVRCIECDDVSMRGCVAGPGARRFADLRGAGRQPVRMVGNDLTAAREPWAGDAEVIDAGNLT